MSKRMLSVARDTLLLHTWMPLQSIVPLYDAPLPDCWAGVLHQTSFRASCYQEQAQLIDDLMVAVEDRRITFITYQSARSTEPLTYDVYPYGLVHHRGSLYLVAYSCRTGLPPRSQL